jgi:hypothetical protein
MPIRLLPAIAALIAVVAAPGCGGVQAGAEADGGSRADAAPADGPLPPLLSATGLFLPGTRQVDPAHLAYSPQYPLWSDGAAKQRWLSLPAGGVIDASNPDAWAFPVGTRLWKTFSHQGHPVETRFMQRLADGSWRFAAYAWDAEGGDARLVPDEGMVLQVAAAPDGHYAVPSQGDCLACHGSSATPVLGLGALQLSPDRDPLAPHGQPATPGDADLRSLVAAGRLAGLPDALLQQPPRIAARTPVERAALGYLHANCGHCHDRGGSAADGVPVDLSLRQRVAPHATTPPAAALLAAGARYGGGGHDGLLVPGDPAGSLLLQRMQTRNPYAQMPPLGTRLADPEGTALVARWIAELERTPWLEHNEELP